MVARLLWLRKAALLLCLLASLQAANGDTKLRIVHVNDNHARFDPQTASFSSCTNPAVCFGGFARMTTAVKQARSAAASEGIDFLMLHAGDQFTGTSWDYVYTSKNNQVAPPFLNALGLDAFVLGNHEFDYGPVVLAPFIDALTAPVISCNVDVSAEPLLAGKVQRYVVKTLPVSGQKVAIIGLTTQETAATSSPGPKVKFLDPLISLPGCITAAKAEGAQIIIALTHIGAALDFALAANPAANDVDLVIGAHSHTLFYGPQVPAGQPQIAGNPAPLMVTPATPETNVPVGPFPTNILNNGKTIPVVSALWASRWI